MLQAGPERSRRSDLREMELQYDKPPVRGMTGKGECRAPRRRTRSNGVPSPRDLDWVLVAGNSGCPADRYTPEASRSRQPHPASPETKAMLQSAPLSAILVCDFE